MDLIPPIRLSAPGLRPLSPTSSRPFVARVTDAADRPNSAEALLVRTGDAAPPGFRAYLFDAPSVVDGLQDAFVVAKEHAHVGRGDVVLIDPQRRTLTSLYRRSSRFNSLLVTERCDNYCVMCSQPPRDVDDTWISDVLEQAIPLISRDTVEIGITGGEPGLLGPRLLRLVTSLRDHLPSTALHILSNGRRFRDLAFARDLARVRHHDLMIGIPLYADLARDHDFIVQSVGAYDDTLRGILNLKRSGLRVELRFVVQRDTVERMTALAEFVARNLRFLDHVAIMGLELTGFARANLDEVWVDPLEYRRELTEAVSTLTRAGLATSIYNHPLCVIDERVWPFARKSISDWKNEYAEECGACCRRAECGGFFVTSRLRRTRGVRAIETESVDDHRLRAERIVQQRVSR
jgi:His-Xaa-Ser system radical SAM maturase HxsC